MATVLKQHGFVSSKNTEYMYYLHVPVLNSCQILEAKGDSQVIRAKRQIDLLTDLKCPQLKHFMHTAAAQ